MLNECVDSQMPTKLPAKQHHLSALRNFGYNPARIPIPKMARHCKDIENQLMPWKAFIDGGSRGNPGPAGVGVVLLNERGKVVFAGGFFLGRLTNNQAEY